MMNKCPDPPCLSLQSLAWYRLIFNDSCRKLRHCTLISNTPSTPVQVRVVDKHVRGGRLYLKKGTVVDVHPGGQCDVAMDEGNDVVQVSCCSMNRLAQLTSRVPYTKGRAGKDRICWRV